MSSTPNELRNIYPPDEYKDYFKWRFNDISVIMWDPQGSFFYVIFFGCPELCNGPFNSHEEAKKFAKSNTNVIEKYFGSIANSKGKENEQRALNILLHMNMEARPAFQEEESEGYDIIIKLGDKEYPIQIKSSKGQRPKHRKKYSNVPCFIINENRTDQEITSDFKRFFRAASSSLFRCNSVCEENGIAR